MLRLLLRKGLWNGLIGGSRVWLALGTVAAIIRLLRRLGGSEPEIVYQEQLKPGESLLISHPQADS